jgi:hypothetical protein
MPLQGWLLACTHPNSSFAGQGPNFTEGEMHGHLIFHGSRLGAHDRHLPDQVVDAMDIAKTKQPRRTSAQRKHMNVAEPGVLERQKVSILSTLMGPTGRGPRRSFEVQKPVQFHLPLACSVPAGLHIERRAGATSETPA